MAVIIRMANAALWSTPDLMFDRGQKSIVKGEGELSDGAKVVIVTVAFTAAVPFNETGFGATVQVVVAGAPVQLKPTL